MQALHRYGVLALCLALGLARLSSAQTAAVTGLVWLFLGGFHTLYLVYATGWRDFQIVIR